MMESVYNVFQSNLQIVYRKGIEKHEKIGFR